jgi:hypothetical protein
MKMKVHFFRLREREVPGARNAPGFPSFWKDPKVSGATSHFH